MTDQNFSYDVAVDLGQLIRIQVKSTREARIPVGRQLGQVPLYKFQMTRPRGQRLYAKGTFELYALVALDIHQIAYMPPSWHKTLVFIGVPGSRPGGKHFEDFPFAKAIAELGLS